MKNFLQIIILTSFLISCSSKSDKEKLLGNWSIVNGHNEFEFYKDSLIIYEYGAYYINDWEIDESSLYLEPIKGLDSFALKAKSFDYRLSKDLDTLFIKRHTDSNYKIPILRIDNALDYLLKRNNIVIDLPTEQNLRRQPDSTLGLNIYIGYRNDKLIAKSDDDRNLDLTDINFFSQEYAAKYRGDSKIGLHYNLIADKKVEPFKLDSIRRILRSTNFTSIFRVYTNDKIDYKKTNWKDVLIWYGKIE